MRYIWALSILFVFTPLAQPDQKEKKAPKTQVITGCLDEKADYYVLRSDNMLSELAALEPVGFEKQFFARFVGHKVSITGELVGSSQPPTLRVANPSHIKDVSDMCMPAAEK